MKFQNYNSLRIFNVVADKASFSDAAVTLNLTKGAVSYQIRRLEEDVGFNVFHRLPRGVSLTDKGKILLECTRQAFKDIDNKIGTLREEIPTITIGVSTYFASRWLSERLMDFMDSHPSVRIRIQPMIDLVDISLTDIDLVIRWGDGRWNDLEIKPLLPCPAFVTGAPSAMEVINKCGLQNGISQLTLLKDREGSTAWKQWHEIAGLEYSDKEGVLVIPDPNVRVRSVIDGQGIALNDKLIARELESGELVKVSNFQLDHYGYFLAYPPESMLRQEIRDFSEWLLSKSKAS